jgi:hypothetical protein
MFMENKTTQQSFSFSGILKQLSAAFESLFVSESAKDFRRWKNFLAS